MRGTSGKNSVILLLLLLAGSMIGSAVWGLLVPYLPKAMIGSFAIGTTGEPWKLDLNFIRFTFGFVLNVNLGSVIGMFIGIVFYYKS